ncbi:hypothetical protein OUZ56_001466 [Daphnia magna]|uniref:Uncharacterized protein n=1 Tax=Daphnia magna TaxID=35525 RepID=A0ABR0A2Q5_9CRUS|nr:hypothetical protein OUZ56_001466 [Daphnia magna]
MPNQSVTCKGGLIENRLEMHWLMPLIDSLPILCWLRVQFFETAKGMELSAMNCRLRLKEVPVDGQLL